MVPPFEGQGGYGVKALLVNEEAAGK